MRVMLERRVDITVGTFATHIQRITQPPALPTSWLPGPSMGGGMVALRSPARRGTADSWIFVLHEATNEGRGLTVFRVSDARTGELSTPPSAAADISPVPPCQSWSAFFVKGVGAPARNPVVLNRWENDGAARSISIDPASHTLDMRPVLRFSTRDINELRESGATFMVSVTATVGRTPFVLLGLVRHPDGSYSEGLFTPGAGHQGWSAFVNTPGAATEFSFYALGEPRRLCYQP